MHREELLVLVNRLGKVARDDITPPESAENFLQSASLVCRSGPRTDRMTRIRERIRHLEAVLQQWPDTRITLAGLAHVLHLEPTYCCRVFLEATGMRFSVWLARIRIERARHLLHDHNQAITDIAHAVGFGDITTFERNFRKVVGVCPQSFRRSIAEPEANFQSPTDPDTSRIAVALQE